MNEYDTRNSGREDSPETPPDGQDTSAEILNDGLFTIKVTEDMTFRNNLRRGLVEAQGKNLDRIPMYVSWPHWLDDGIVCLYAKDLHRVLHDTVQRTALVFRSEFGIDTMDDTPAPFEEHLPGEPLTQPAASKSPQTATSEAEPAEAAASETGSGKETASPPEPAQSTPEAPAPAPKKDAPPSHQDIADQLFAELKKGKRD